MRSSLASRLSRLDLRAVTTPEERAWLLYCWPFWARPSQTAPVGDWTTWFISAGRGWGKTRVGAEWVRSRVEDGARRIALVARTAADTRDVMVEGESGLLSIFPPHQRPVYESSKRRVTFHTGAIATLYSADEPNLLRGPQHDSAWCDELASWRDPDAWDQLLFGLRLGLRPRVVVTTTPRPTRLVRGIIARPDTVVTRGSTYENRANLAQSFLDTILAKYEGTRLGRQELYAEILDDTPGALWTRAQLEALQVGAAPALRRTVVAVDPSVAADGGGDECGLVVAGIAEDGILYVLADGSGKLSPEQWAKRAAALADEHDADAIVAETNQGGALVTDTLRLAAPGKRVLSVHASKGKRARAEPVAALYEQRRVRHVRGLHQLEDELCTWAALSGDPSPNRLDALVWALHALALTTPRRNPTEDYVDY